MARYHPLGALAEDIEYLQRVWLQEPADDELRRGSAILRRLLVEQVLSKAWRSVGLEKQPSIIAPDLLEMLPYAPEVITFAFAGGAATQGGEIAGAFVIEVPAGGQAPSKVRESPAAGSPPPMRAWPLSSFLESPSLIVGGEVVCRREVIKYFANVLGGVHLDLSPKARHREEELVQRMTKIEERVKFLNRNALPLELLSIGQAVAKAPDVADLLARLRIAAPAV